MIFNGKKNDLSKRFLKVLNYLFDISIIESS